MSDELTLWEQPVSRRGFMAGATAAAFAAAGLSRLAPDAFAASDAETLNFYNWAQYVNPKTYPVFTKATGIKVKKSFYDSNETLHAKLKGRRARLRPRLPVELHDEAAHRGEARSSRSTGRS